MNYEFTLREQDGSGYRIDCVFGRRSATEFAAKLLGDDAADNFPEHERGGCVFPVGTVGAFTLTATRRSR